METLTLLRLGILWVYDWEIQIRKTMRTLFEPPVVILISLHQNNDKTPGVSWIDEELSAYGSLGQLPRLPDTSEFSPQREEENSQPYIFIYIFITFTWHWVLWGEDVLDIPAKQLETRYSTGRNRNFFHIYMDCKRMVPLNQTRFYSHSTWLEEGRAFDYIEFWEKGIRREWKKMLLHWAGTMSGSNLSGFDCK